MRKKRVFIWGSCVSRDTFEHLPHEEFELVRYVARQSALSASNRPVELLGAPRLKSNFQQRMVNGDFGSSLKSQLADTSGNVDLILVDLTDERLGVYQLPDGSVVTRSVELISSGWEEALPEGTRLLPFGSNEHFTRWSDAMAVLGEFTRSNHPTASIVLLEIPWAARSETGAATPLSFGLKSVDANRAFRRYYRTAEQTLGARPVRLAEQAVVSSPSHPWGEAPFHYAESVYLEVVRAVTGRDSLPSRAHLV